MTCERVSELLAAFADGGLEGREHDQVAAHVAGCARCADEVKVLREVLVETRRAATPPTRDDVFWQGLTRDIRVAVDAAPAARMGWWRMPVMALGFAAAAAAVLLTYARQPALPAPTAHQRARPLPAAFDVDDLDTGQLAAVNAALSDDYADAPDDDELALSGSAAAENLVENLSEADAARVHTSL